MRQGENDNCIMCRGESSCILPISPAAVHTNPAGSRLAIAHFTEYLGQFPDDLEVRWLLNLAHMTLGEYPDGVDSRFRLDLSNFFRSEFDIGRFRDIGHLVGVNRYNQAGGAIMDDFDNDGLLDLVVTSFDPTQPTSFYRNKGDSTFEERSLQAGVTDQLGGLVCYQADYDNDGYLDVAIARGAWLNSEIRPSLLRNNCAGGFTDVTKEAGLMAAVNSNAAGWADYDNDGHVDLLIGCERQTNLLYHNKGDGTIPRRLLRRRGLQGDAARFCKGCAWLDYDNDGYPDLFLNNLFDEGRLYHNNRDRTFTEVTLPMGVSGPRCGFSCWAWDFDNDGWLDIFATSYDRSLADVVNGMLGGLHTCGSFGNRLYRNMNGRVCSRMCAGKRAWIWSSRPWGATLAISITTASSTCIWAPASRASQPLSPTACSRTSAASVSRRSRPLPAQVIFKRATQWRAAIGTATAMSTCSSRPDEYRDRRR